MVTESAPGRWNGPGEKTTPTCEESDAESVGGRDPVRHISPCLVAAPEAAALCGVSERTWRKLDRSASIPRAIRIGRRRLWVVDEIHRWSCAGCPSRKLWEEMKRASEVRRG